MTTHGLPPWEGSPTPPLPVFEVALEVEPDLITRLSTGHLRALLGMAMAERPALRTAATEGVAYQHAAEQLATDLAELQDVAAAHDERKRAKREYMRDFRAARAAQRAGIR